MPKSKQTVRFKSPSKTPYKSQSRKSTTLKKRLDLIAQNQNII